jgi:hypothetical protein
MTIQELKEWIQLGLVFCPGAPLCHNAVRHLVPATVARAADPIPRKPRRDNGSLLLPFCIRFLRATPDLKMLAVVN